MAERHIMYNRQLEEVREAERKGSALVIRPAEKLPINHVSHDAKLMQDAYLQGRKTATREIDRIISFLK